MTRITRPSSLRHSGSVRTIITARPSRQMLPPLKLQIFQPVFQWVQMMSFATDLLLTVRRSGSKVSPINGTQTAYSLERNFSVRIFLDSSTNRPDLDDHGNLF